MQFQVSPKERGYFFLMILLSFLIYGASLAFVVFNPVAIGPVLLYAVGIWLVRFIVSLLLRGHIKGNGIKVGAEQFPEVFAVLKNQSQRLGMKHVPEMYIIQGGGTLNAFAVRFSRRNFVVLYSDVLDAAYQEGMSAVSFIIGHELGHLKRKHTSHWKNLLVLPGRMIPFLGAAYSRACEQTADNIGYHLCPDGAARGLLILAAGKHLYKRVNVNAMLTSFDRESGFATWLTEVLSSHPLLAKRVAAVDALDVDRVMDTQSIYVSPTVDLKSREKQL